MKKTIHWKSKEQVICKIDGIEFEKPRDLGDYILAGVATILLVITCPIWILPYCIGKLIVNISKKKKTGTIIYECPSCERDVVYDPNRLKTVECKRCGFYGWLDHMDTKRKQ